MDYNGAPSLHYMSHHVHRESANEDKEIRKVFHKQMTKSLTVNYNPINAAHMDENHKSLVFLFLNLILQSDMKSILLIQTHYLHNAG